LLHYVTLLWCIGDWGLLSHRESVSVHFIFQYIMQYHNKIKAHLHTFRNTELHDKYIIIGAGCHSFEVQVVTWVLNVINSYTFACLFVLPKCFTAYIYRLLCRDNLPHSVWTCALLLGLLCCSLSHAFNNQGIHEIILYVPCMQ